MSKAIVLLSGGLDSATILYLTKSEGYDVHALVFDYGQRHRKELDCARRIARAARARFDVVKIVLPWKGSSLLDRRRGIPRHKSVNSEKIPSTYVPGRNIIFLSFAVSCAEAIGAEAVFIGANAIDYSGYPDCRPAFFRAYQRAVTKGTKEGVKGRPVRIKAPLVRKTKAQIIRLGTKLGVPYQWSWSCYRGGKRPCGVCDSCRLRSKGFKEAGVEDPLLS